MYFIDYSNFFVLQNRRFRNFIVVLLLPILYFFTCLIYLSAKVSPPTSASDTSGMLRQCTIILWSYLSSCTVTCTTRCIDRHLNIKSSNDNIDNRRHKFILYIWYHIIWFIGGQKCNTCGGNFADAVAYRQHFR